MVVIVCENHSKDLKERSLGLSSPFQMEISYNEYQFKSERF